MGYKTYPGIYEYIYLGLVAVLLTGWGIISFFFPSFTSKSYNRIITPFAYSNQWAKHPGRNIFEKYWGLVLVIVGLIHTFVFIWVGYIRK